MKNILGSPKSKKEFTLLHAGFEIGIGLKAISGFFEIIGGILLIFLTPNRLINLISFLTQDELSANPKNIFSSYLIHFSSNFTSDTQYFGVFYLLSHGIVKLVLVILLWKKKLWAYPLTIIILILFIIYQIYRYTFSSSIELILLSIFDVIVIYLTYVEYRRIKSDFLMGGQKED